MYSFKTNICWYLVAELIADFAHDCHTVCGVATVPVIYQRKSSTPK